MERNHKTIQRQRQKKTKRKKLESTRWRAVKRRENEKKNERNSAPFDGGAVLDHPDVADGARDERGGHEEHVEHFGRQRARDDDAQDGRDAAGEDAVHLHALLRTARLLVDNVLHPLRRRIPGQPTKKNNEKKTTKINQVLPCQQHEISTAKKNNPPSKIT